MSLQNPSRLRLETFPRQGPAWDIRAIKIDYGFLPTPLGRCLIAETRGRICYMVFAPERTDGDRLADLSARWAGASLRSSQQRTARRINELFPEPGSGGAPIKLLVQGTRFQIEVWRALLRLPTGRVQTYACLAQTIGRPKATRAVGTAIGANPIAWLIPCHRVIRSDGQLGGYRWGTAKKKACLAYEKRLIGGLK